MINRLTVMIFSFILLSSIGMYLLVENSKPSEKPELMADANIGNIESAKGIQEFAYLDKKQEVIPFLEVEMKKQEEDKKKEEERLRKIEEEKARIEAEKKAKEEAERKAKEEAERKAKEEAEAKAREAAEQKAREEAIKKERERQQQLKSSSSSSSKQSNQAVSANTSDLEALAKIIHAEAKGEPYQGKVAVGAVILNRVSDSRFPNSIKGVITAPGQFQPVRNGAYQNARPSDADYSAAREALAGADPTGGATFFYAPSIATTSWHETLTPTVTIGGHRFFKN